MGDPSASRRAGRDPRRPAVAELRSRRSAVQGLLAEDDLDGLLVFGNQVAAHDIRYLTGWPPGWDSFLVVPRTGRPRLLVPSENHVPTARSMAAGPTEVRWVGPDPAATVTATVAELLGLPRARRRRRLGLVGPLPYRIHRALAGGLAGYELVDASGSFVRHRLVKGADEIARTHRAAALADLAITTLIRELRPGLREHEVGAILEAAYRRAGGEHGICFLASASMRAPTAIVPSQLWSARRIRSGDLVMLELSVGWGGGWSQILRTFTLGEPTEVVRRLHGVADAAFAAISDRVRPGTTAADLLASAEGIDAAGFTVVDDVVHGYGGGYLPPILRTPATQRRPPPDLALRPGMMLVVQPNVVTSDQRLGVQTGELLIVTADGHERPHRTPLGLVVV